MPGFKFSVPYNNDFSMLEMLAGDFGGGINGNNIEEVYLSAPQEIFGSGRVVKGIDSEHIKNVMQFCHMQGYKVNLAFNSTCEGVEWYKRPFVSGVLNFIKKMRDNGLDGVIFANPLYIYKVRKELKDIEIIASAFCDINTVERASYYERLGATTIVPNGINRDIETLKAIKDATNLKIRLMVNEGCLWQCPYRFMDTNYTSHASKGGVDVLDFQSHACIDERIKNPVVLLKSEWIRPEDLEFYKDITKNFKIVGRTMSSEWIKKVVGYYLNEDYDGNLLEILESATPKYLTIKKTKIDNKSLDGFLKKVASCDKNCFRCHYCDELAEKIIKFA